MLESSLVVNAARALDAVFDTAMKTIHAPLWKRDADDGNIQRASLRHRIERGNDHLMGKIAGDTEYYQRVRLYVAHDFIMRADIAAPICQMRKKIDWFSLRAGTEGEGCAGSSNRCPAPSLG
jgi:hypothetical protein